MTQISPELMTNGNECIKTPSKIPFPLVVIAQNTYLPEFHVKIQLQSQIKIIS